MNIKPGTLFKIEPCGEYSLGHAVDNEEENVKIYPQEILMFIEERPRRHYRFLKPGGTRVVVELAMELEEWTRANMVGVA